MTSWNVLNFETDVRYYCGSILEKYSADLFSHETTGADLANMITLRQIIQAQASPRTMYISVICISEKESD